MAQRQPIIADPPGLPSDQLARPVGGILLAAGLSLRMGQPKLLLPFGQGTILSETIRQAQAAQIQPLILVSGAYRAEVEAVGRAAGLWISHNPDFAAGQSGSLQAGLKLLPKGLAAMFLLGDQPLIRAATYRQLLAAWQQDEPWLLAPRDAAGQRGNPTICAPPLFAALNRLTGDRGARQLFRDYAEKTRYLTVADAAVTRDIDDQASYQSLLAQSGDRDENIDII